MGNQATKRQKELLTIIYQYIKDMGYPPTFEEMRESLNVSSNQSVIDLLKKLKDSGLVQRGEGARSIAVLPLGYDVLGKPPLVGFLGAISAGVPMEAIEISGEWQAMTSGIEKIERLKDEVFMLKISGDSMINAGIDNGDLVLVQFKREFISGDIVYAQIGDEATIKRFISDDRPPYVYLKPENPAYDIIPFTEETELKGKVISILKNDYWKLANN
jgi:repressor LexA